MSKQDEILASLDRDLRFYPSRCEAPKRLTGEQVAFFNEQGYLKRIRIFDAAGVEANRRYFDGLLAKVAAEGKDSYSINGYHRSHAGIWDLTKHPLILEYVEDLLGPKLVAWGTHYFCKMPGDGKAVSWHQDASYWPLTPSKTVTVWLAIDRATGGTRLGRQRGRSAAATWRSPAAISDGGPRIMVRDGHVPCRSGSLLPAEDHAPDSTLSTPAAVTLDHPGGRTGDPGRPTPRQRPRL